MPPKRCHDGDAAETPKRRGAIDTATAAAATDDAFVVGVVVGGECVTIDPSHGQLRTLTGLKPERFGGLKKTLNVTLTPVKPVAHPTTATKATKANVLIEYFANAAVLTVNGPKLSDSPGPKAGFHEGPNEASHRACVSFSFSEDIWAEALTTAATQPWSDAQRVDALSQYVVMLNEVLVLLPARAAAQYFGVLAAAPFMRTNLGQPVTDALRGVILRCLQQQVAQRGADFADRDVVSAFQDLVPGPFQKALMSLDHLDFVQQLIGVVTKK